MEMPNQEQGHGPETTVLILLIAFFRGLSMAEFDQVTHVILTCFEVIGAILIVVINWKKAIGILRGKNKSK